MQNRPGSDLDGLVRAHLVWKQAGVQESSGPVFGRTQPARYQFPTFRFSSVLPQTSRIILCKTSREPVSFWLTVSGFGQMDPVRKQANVQESSGPLLANQCFPADPDRMRIGSGMFTAFIVVITVSVIITQCHYRTQSRFRSRDSP